MLWVMQREANPWEGTVCEEPVREISCTSLINMFSGDKIRSCNISLNCCKYEGKIIHLTQQTVIISLKQHAHETHHLLQQHARLMRDLSSLILLELSVTLNVPSVSKFKLRLHSGDDRFCHTKTKMSFCSMIRELINTGLHPSCSLWCEMWQQHQRGLVCEGYRNTDVLSVLPSEAICLFPCGFRLISIFPKKYTPNSDKLKCQKLFSGTSVLIHMHLVCALQWLDPIMIQKQHESKVSQFSCDK